jgi:hypothetical protein
VLVRSDLRKKKAPPFIARTCLGAIGVPEGADYSGILTPDASPWIFRHVEQLSKGLMITSGLASRYGCMQKRGPDRNHFRPKLLAKLPARANTL